MFPDQLLGVVSLADVKKNLLRPRKEWMLTIV
jgi:hypothetical protein